MSDAKNPDVGDIFTDRYGDLVVVVYMTSYTIEIEYEDGVPIVHTMKRWRQLVDDGFYR